MRIRKTYQNLKRLFRQQDLVLMYHRIAAATVDPWQLAVSPENFEQQLQVLQKTKQVVPLQQLVSQFSSRSFRKRNIAITFDDGYLDNYLVAKPLLEKYNLPATFFITSLNIGKKREFWWDELEKIILGTPELPQHLTLEINGDCFFFDLGYEITLTEELQRKHSEYVAFEPPTLRSQLYLKLWERLTPLSALEQRALVEQVRSWANTTAAARIEYSCMSAEQVSTLASNILFSIGGHTTSHPALANLKKEVQRNEIRQNKAFLEGLIKDEVSFFAYPSGIYNDTAVAVLKEEGFDAGFTTNFGCISKMDDHYLLNRVQVNNWDGNAFDWVINKFVET